MDAQSPRDPLPEDNVGYLIGDVSRMIRTVYDRRVEPLGLTRAQWRLLIRLSRVDGCSQTELAAALEIKKPSLGKLIERLEAKGWVERRDDPGDARTKRVHLTSKAHPLLEEMYAHAGDVLDDIFDGLSTADADRLQASLMHIKRNLADMLSDGEATNGEEPR